jgi:hypothetical protein
MKLQRFSLLALVPIVAIGCSGSNGDTGSKQTGPGVDGGTMADAGQEGAAPGMDSGTVQEDTGTTTGTDGSTPSGSNVAPVIVDQGPAAAGGSVDVPFISVTLCIPSTSTCQTIDHVSVDTGSSGMRVMSSVLSSLALPQVNATTGNALVECMQFGDGFTWGSVRMADLKIAGEVAAKIPIQIIGDPAFATVPTDCSSSGPSEDTVPTFGSNGLIGINQIIPDCGDYCAGSPAQPGGYYSCTGGTCTAVAVANAAQVSNPIAFFAQDSNGAVLQFPSVPSTGAATLAGSLIFGIGTASNNGLGSAKVLTVDVNGNFTTTFNGATFNTSYIDSGTNTLSFNDSSIPQCTDPAASGFDCPTSTVSLMAQNTGINSVSATVSFSVANSDTLFGSNDAAFDDLATPGVDANTFAWGFPFFIGRSVYVALDGAMTPGGAGPYVAY